MDQDFHYYGTYYAAVTGGFAPVEATLIAQASNFIDFLHEGDYAGYWVLVRNATAPSSEKGYLVVDHLNNPRYTFQAAKLSAGCSPDDGLWCSFHFTPGNYADPAETPSHATVHGDEVARFLPGHEIRDVDPSITASSRKLLNRPQSALSRALIMDTIACATDDKRIEAILQRAKGGWELLQNDRANALERFRLILTGARAHVIADTWAHQDFAGISDKINTYWDVDGGNWGRQSIYYTDTGDWTKVILASTSHENLQAAPNGTSYLGHGWMGHFPDYSFAKFKYKPCWRAKTAEPFVRDNPQQYIYAWVELCSLFSQCNGSRLPIGSHDAKIAAAQQAIAKPCNLADKTVCPRKKSSEAWMEKMTAIGVAAPSRKPDAKLEPDRATVLDGLVAKTTATSFGRYGHYYVNACSDLYMFQIAIDYHFHFVKHFLHKHEIMEFTGSWSQKTGALSPLVSDLFEKKSASVAERAVSRPARLF